MKHLCTIILLAGWLCQVQAAPFAYVINGKSNDLSVIDIATQQVVNTVPAGIRPETVAVSPDGSKVYVANHDDSILVLNTLDNSVTAIKGVGFGAKGIAISPDRTRVYVVNPTFNNISVINTINNSVIASVPIAADATFSIVVSSDGTKVYVCGFKNFSVVNTTTTPFSVTSFSLAGGLGLAISPDNSKLYVPNYYNNSLTVINTDHNTVNTTIAVGIKPSFVAVSPDGNTVYVTNQDDTISIIDTVNNVVIDTIVAGAGPTGVTFSPDGTLVYIANQHSNTVSVVNTSTHVVLNTIRVDLTPLQIGIVPPRPRIINKVAGLTFDSLMCQNNTTRQTVFTKAPAVITDCQSAGLVVHIGDQISLISKGTAL